MKLLDRLNQRGFGWHADMLRARAAREGRTMAELFAESISNAAAYNVPAKAVAVVRSDADGHMIRWQFLDGSTTNARVGRHC